MKKNRRTFIRQTGLTTIGLGILGLQACQNTSNNSKPADTTEETPAENIQPVIPPPAQNLLFDISLAQWSLNRTINNGQLAAIDFPAHARTEFDIGAVEYVTQFFQQRARDEVFLKELKKRADDHGVRSLLIMIDNEGDLASTDLEQREKAARSHFQWVEAAHMLGCHSIRVNAAGNGPAEEMAKSAATSLYEIADFAKDFGINVIVENHGGRSSDAAWLAGVIKEVNMANCGTLPDFGNFCVEKKGDRCVNEYDRYKGMEELLPWAKGVSAKSYDFDSDGNETTIDFARMVKMVVDSGYKGHIGIEYEGNRLSEAEGIKATKQLLEGIRSNMEES